MRLGHEEMRGEYFLDDGAYFGQRQLRLTTAAPFALKKAVSDRRQDHVTFPAWEGASFEVIQPDLVLEFLILLLDCPG